MFSIFQLLFISIIIFGLVVILELGLILMLLSNAQKQKKESKVIFSEEKPSHPVHKRKPVIHSVDELFKKSKELYED